MQRRTLIQSAAWLALGYPIRGLSAFLPTPRFSADPFSAGVASGDPTPNGIVLWTRLIPDDAREREWQRESVPVHWEIAADEGMKRIVRSGRTQAQRAYAHSVHVDVRGLQPNRWYWYRFRTGSATSPVGRTRTAPAGPVDRLRFAFASCQSFQAGYYTAYQHMVREEIEFIVFLGDYIYESGGTVVRTVPNEEPMTLDGYRDRYALYRSDEHLKEAHRLFPWIITWDDHEVENNYAGDISQDNVPRAEFLKRRAAAYQAHYEWMPLQKACIPNGPNSRLYRKLSFGPLANFFVLDGRQYRSDQPCGDGTKPPCAEFYDDHRTMLGRAQENWLNSVWKKSRAHWNIMANQVRMTPVDSKAGPEELFSMDQWAGYENARKRFVSGMADARLSNPVVITGDIHTNWVGDLKIDYREQSSPIVATELVGTSISTGGDGADSSPAVEQYLSEAPQIHFFNAQRGYVRCEVTKDALTSDFRVVEKVSVKDLPIKTRATFVVENGLPGAKRS
jgi:alkaline phosphatase D